MCRSILTVLLLALPGWMLAQTVRTDTLGREVPVGVPQTEVKTPVGVAQPRISTDKPWMEADESMPSVFGSDEQAAEKKSVRYTLHPYTPTTPFDWDPVYQRKIAINKDTWRGRFWQAARSSDVAHMGISGFVRYPAADPDKVHFEHGVLVGDYATLLTQYFTAEFWRFRDKKNRKVTLELLKGYRQWLNAGTGDEPSE